MKLKSRMAGFAGHLALMAALATVVSSHSLSDSHLSHRRDPRAASGDPDIVINPDNGTLSDVLGTLGSDTSVLLLPGTYTLDSYTPVTSVSNICISGRGNVTITCTDNVGLVFIDVTNLVISGIRIEGCGLSGSNLMDSLNQIRQFIDLFYVVYPDMSFALLVGHSQDVNITNVQVANNEGFGLVGINVIGSSVFHQLEVRNNVQPIDCANPGEQTVEQAITDPFRYGGGVVLLYQDYKPGFQVADRYDLTISEGQFEQNSECSYSIENYLRGTDSALIRRLGYRIGGGGGLTLLLAQLNYGVNIVTRDSRFENNAATLGASGHVAIFSGVKNTDIEFENCTFAQNGFVDLTATNPEISARILGGAGLAVAADLRYPDNTETTPSHVVHNLNTSMRITDSVFSQNVAQYGGGLYFYSAYWSAVSDLTDVLRFYISGCVFQENIAYVGSAIQFSETKLSGAEIGTLLQITDTDVLVNRALNHPNGSFLQSSAVVSVKSINVTLNLGNPSIFLHL